MNQHLNEHYRQRRGFINGVGYLANSLFGVLDEHFAEKYSQDIELVKLNEQDLVSLWKNQTSIVESEYNLLKRTEEVMSKQHMYHCCGTCEVKVMCGEHIVLKQLNNTGRLYLEPGCLIKGSDYTLHIPKTNNNKLEIQSNIYVPIIDPINNIINSSLLNTENLNVSESKDLQNALQKLHVRIEDLENSPPVLETSLTSHDTHQYVITYIIVIVIVLATGVLLWRRRRLSANRAIISDDRASTV
ncbi:uncharacterized protein LOC134200372 [Bombyx mori]|uniref:uncharacterized protein LOC134200372 n=1 Tax=Bombyx mori TaxID=7091 RepID=UPI002ED5E514